MFPLRSGIRTMKNGNPSRLSKSLKTKTPSTIVISCISCIGTKMFAFELEFGGIDQSKGSTKFTTIIQVTLIIDESCSIPESHCSPLVYTHERFDELILICIKMKVCPKGCRINTHRNTNTLFKQQVSYLKIGLLD